MPYSTRTTHYVHASQLIADRRSDTETRTKNPRPVNWFEAAARTMTVSVATTTANIESKRRCPNHNPTGSDSPFDSCIACTDERRSFATYSEKNAGYTAFVVYQLHQLIARHIRHTMAAPKNATHFSATSVPAAIPGKL